MKEQPLNKKNLEELKMLKQDMMAQKAELELKKSKSPEDWTEANQTELEDLTIEIVDVEDAIEEKQLDGDKYKPAAGTEKSVHLVVCKNIRFDQATGKRIANEFIQMYSFSEWQVFKKNFKSLGYVIIKVLYDPYNEAEKFVTK